MPGLIQVWETLFSTTETDSPSLLRGSYYDHEPTTGMFICRASWKMVLWYIFGPNLVSIGYKHVFGDKCYPKIWQVADFAFVEKRLKVYLKKRFIDSWLTVQ